MIELLGGKKKKTNKRNGRKYGHVAREERRKERKAKAKRTSSSAAPDQYRDPVQQQVPAMPAPVLYSADDLEHVKAPTLHNGDRRDKKKFRNAYIKYVIAHEAVM